MIMSSAANGLSFALNVSVWGSPSRFKMPGLPLRRFATIVMTALFEDIFFGEPGLEAPADAAALWISDMPELNEQTRLKDVEDVPPAPTGTSRELVTLHNLLARRTWNHPRQSNTDLHGSVPASVVFSKN